jgi:hypothetical protein
MTVRTLFSRELNQDIGGAKKAAKYGYKPPAFSRFLFQSAVSPPSFNPPAGSWWSLSSLLSPSFEKSRTRCLSALGLLHSPVHEPSHRRQVDTEVLGDFPIGVGARGAGRHHGGVPFTGILGNLPQR